MEFIINKIKQIFSKNENITLILSKRGDKITLYERTSDKKIISTDN